MRKPLQTPQNLDAMRCHTKEIQAIALHGSKIKKMQIFTKLHDFVFKSKVPSCKFALPLLLDSLSVTSNEIIFFNDLTSESLDKLKKFS